MERALEGLLIADTLDTLRVLECRETSEVKVVYMEGSGEKPSS